MKDLGKGIGTLFIDMKGSSRYKKSMVY